MMKLFAINEYEVEGCKYNALELRVSHQRWRGGMILSVRPVEETETGYLLSYGYSENPLTSEIDVAIIPMVRKSKKRMEAAFADLVGMAPRICEMWNERNFDGIKDLFGISVAV